MHDVKINLVKVANWGTGVVCGLQKKVKYNLKKKMQNFWR